MVVITEQVKMFWGITLDSGKRYTQTVERGFHISMAALEHNPKLEGKKSHVAVMIGHEKAEFLLCSLDQVRVPQQPLDLNFVEGEEVTFFLNGNGHVHLTGYLVDDEFQDDPMDESFDPEMADVSEGEVSADSDEDEEESDEDEESEAEEEDDDSEEDVPKLLPLEGPDFDESDEDSEEDSEEEVIVAGKRKKQKMQSPKKKAKPESSEEEEESDEDEMGGSFVQAKQELSPSKSQPSTPQANGESSKKKKKNKKKKKAQEMGQGDQKTQPKTPNEGKGNQKSQPNTPAKKEGDGKKGQTPGKNIMEKKGTPGQKQATGTPASSKKTKRIMEGNVIAEEVKDGHGPEAKPGKTVAVYYTGKLQNGKTFDACSSGKPFKFKLGKSEVIKGWDVGVKGMKVGGKRKLTIPSKMAYGSQSLGGIPANSTLVFDVELKSVS